MIKRLLAISVIVTVLIYLTATLTTGKIVYSNDQYSIEKTGLFEYTVWLSQSIENSTAYLELYRILNNLDSRYIIVFKLDGYGGSVQTFLHLSNAIIKTEATTVMEVMSNVYSAHAFLAVIGDKLNMPSTAQLLFHGPQLLTSTGQVSICKKQTVIDKPELTQHALLICPQFYKFAEKHLKELLNKEDYVRLISGEDVVVDYLESK